MLKNAVSGHTFILVHAILLLATTIAPSVRLGLQGKQPPLQRLTTGFALFLIALSWWMLLMTASFFHQPSEKLSGFAAGVLGWLSYRLTVG